MKSKVIKNYGYSVKDRLLNMMNTSGYPYMYLLTRYLNERLLYRLSVSHYKEHFFLKGGSLIYAYNGLETRPTVDIDFMADYITRDREVLRTVFQEILSIECVEDGVIFKVDNIEIEPIAIDKKYPGTRLSFIACLDSITHRMSIDIGFGDVITPSPLLLDYPSILPNVPSVNIYAYNLETLIAEKFQTMIERDLANSRMKDFFDVYQILSNYEIDHDVLKEAIANTFHNRNMVYSKSVNLFTPEFALDPERQVRWKHFLKKIHWKTPIEFMEVMAVIRTELGKYWNESIG